MSERRAIRLGQEIGSNLYHVVRANPQKESVERHVVQAAEGQPVADHGLTVRLCIRDDVSSFEQLVVPQMTQSTLMPVRGQDSLAEGSLMQPTAGDRGYVPSPDLTLFSEDESCLGQADMLRVIHRNLELSRFRG